MRKISGIVAIALFVLVGPCTFLWAMDFDSMSNQELFELRGAIRNAPEADRAAYQDEWEERVAGMSDEEKKQFDDIVTKEETDDGKLKDPIVPARGYEKQLEEGQSHVIFGGFPERNGTGR